MDKSFQKLLRLGINLAPVGIERCEENTPYFCTPKGASIFGWTGADGIHYCFIRGFGGMVFSVNPMNSSSQYVHPVAKDFKDFLRLILACGNEAAIEQSWLWDEKQFTEFLRKNPVTEEQKQVLSEITGKFHLTPMENPWKYMKALESAFDYSKIQYTEDYYDVDMNPAIEPTPPEWKVYFDGNFWGHSGKDRAGKEIVLGTRFNWAGRHWVIPAAYACSKGLVVDFCMQVDPEEIRCFMKKWNLSPENDAYGNFSREQQMTMEIENPLSFHLAPRIELNGKTLRTSHGCAVAWNPCLPEEFSYELEAKWVVDHYGLDASFGWVVCRDAFLWVTKHRPEIQSLSLTMEQHPIRLLGPHFKAQRAGDSFAFSHPISGTKYTLTVQELEQQTIPSGTFRSDLWQYPTHIIAMSYTISPEPTEEMTVCDCADSDQPLEIIPEESSEYLPTAKSDVAVIGIIGGADGPTAVVLGNKRQTNQCTAHSSLHFEPVEEVEWRMDFIIKQFAEETFPLI